MTICLVSLAPASGLVARHRAISPSEAALPATLCLGLAAALPGADAVAIAPSTHLLAVFRALRTPGPAVARPAPTRRSRSLQM